MYKLRGITEKVMFGEDVSESSVQKSPEGQCKSRLEASAQSMQEARKFHTRSGSMGQSKKLLRKET